MEKLDKILSRLIGSFFGVFIGTAFYSYVHYRRYPGLYEIQSAPWYTTTLVTGFFTALIIIAAVIAKYYIKRRSRV